MPFIVGMLVRHRRIKEVLSLHNHIGHSGWPRKVFMLEVVNAQHGRSYGTWMTAIWKLRQFTAGNESPTKPGRDRIPLADGKVRRCLQQQGQTVLWTREVINHERRYRAKSFERRNAIPSRWKATGRERVHSGDTWPRRPQHL